MKNRNSDVFDVILDEEERELSEALDKAIDKGEIKSVDNLQGRMAAARKAAANYFRKDARVTLRLSNTDLSILKRKAVYKGLPYQTFIASVLHEYAAGHFGT